MNRRPLFIFLLFLVSFATGSAQALRAQDTSTPAASSTPSAGPSAAPQQSSEKKVWTNDDVPNLRQGAPISTVGSNSNGTRSTSQKTRQPAARRDASWYSDQITRLQRQIPPLDAQIAKLQDGIDGKFTGDGHTSTRPIGVRGGSWQAELVQLQKKRADIQSRIQDLEIQARRDGIPENRLP